jgi:hypothetical protein
MGVKMRIPLKRLFVAAISAGLLAALPVWCAPQSPKKGTAARRAAGQAKIARPSGDRTGGPKVMSPRDAKPQGGVSGKELRGGGQKVSPDVIDPVKGQGPQKVSPDVIDPVKGQGPQKVSPDVIDPVKGQGSQKVSPDVIDPVKGQGSQKVSPDVIDPATGKTTKRPAGRLKSLPPR